MRTSEMVARALDYVGAWEEAYAPFEPHPSMHVAPEAFDEALGRYVERLAGNYPFFHPSYAGQMIKPPHPVAVAAYAAAQSINPNNHALDGGPPTAEMEREVVAKLAAMLGLPDAHLGHLTTGGTIANLEALFVARELAPGKAVAFSADAHYTHARMAHVLGMPTRSVPTDEGGRLDLNALEDSFRTGEVGTVVVTAGTTGLGVVDPIADVLPLARRYGVRVHVDAAYGGFFVLLARAGDAALGAETRRHLGAVGEADSVAVDPHKHGLQPYGCGAVLFRDPSVGRFYVHDSPYTYFTSEALHLGEISLECSRAGAAAGALWLTLELLPLEADRGLGPILAACLRAARAWHAAVEGAAYLRPFAAPELDIVTYFPRLGTASRVDAASAEVFALAMGSPDPIFPALFVTPSARLAALGIAPDVPSARVLRSVLLKPEHETVAPALVARLDALASSVASSAF